MPAIDAVVMRCPPPRSVQPGSSARIAYTCDITLMRHWRSQTSSGASGPPPVASPAFANHASIGPMSRSPSSTSARVAASSPTSSTRATTRSPASLASRSTPAPSRSAATTVRAPRSTSPRTSAPPIPPAAPVTTMMLPSVSMPGTLRAAGSAPICVRPEVDEEGETDEEPLDPGHVAPAAPVPERGVAQGRPGQQEEAEQRDDPAVVGAAEDVAEEPQHDEDEPGGDERE